MPFPEHESEMRRIAQQHEHAVDGPLMLAVYFRDEEHPESDSMLEVYSKYNNKQISPDGHILVTEFGSMPGLALLNGGTLRLTITNKAELYEALDGEWPEIQPILAAIRADEYSVAHVPDRSASGLLERLKRKSRELHAA